MRWAVLLLPLLAACQEELSAEEQAALAARDVALVQQAAQMLPPLEPLVPEPILYDDIERHGLYGAGCNYAPGTSLGTRVIAQPEVAYMKIDGEMMRFASDPGAQSLPLGSRSQYDSRHYRLQLSVDGEGAQSGDETVDYEGTVVLRDKYGRIIYEGTGLAQCGS